MWHIEFLSQSELDDLANRLKVEYRFRRVRLLKSYALQFDQQKLLESIKLCNGKRQAIYSLCPFHEERTGSFRLLPDGSAHCFGCGYQAGIVELIYDLWRPDDLDGLMSLVRRFSQVRQSDGYEQLLLDFSTSSH